MIGGGGAEGGVGRKRLVAGVVALVVVASASIAAWVWLDRGGDSSREPVAPPSALSPTQIPEPVLDRLSEQVTSGAPRDVAEVMAVPSGQQLNGRFVRQLASMRIEFVPGTAVSLDATTARVDAEVTTGDGEVRSWYVVLAEQDPGSPDSAYVLMDTQERP